MVGWFVNSGKVMKNSSKLTYLRQLCTLNVPESALMPQVLSELSELLHLDMCCFNWVDGNGDISHAHTAGLCPPPSMIARYVGQYVNDEESELGLTTRDMRLHPNRFLGSRALGQGFSETILFNDILRPLGLKYISNIGVFLGGRMFGTLSCNRSGDQREFSDKDTQNLSLVLPYLAMAAKPRHELDLEWHQEENHGLILIDTQGRIKYADELGILRLYQATRCAQSGTLKTHSDDRLLMPLKELALAMLKLEKGSETALPELQFYSEGYKYVLKARAMKASPSEPLSLISVSILQWAPHRLKLLKWLSEQGLSLRHRELALAIFDGHSIAEAAKRMAISKATAQDYLELIYVRLSVGSRQALLKRMSFLQ
jgi:DNA-binding CsgD family transcriptional regulator